MTKQINAKFTSRCKACGSDINPGDLISYDPAVKYSSRHVTCPSSIASKVLLNSPGRGALQGRGKGDFFLGEKSEIVRSYAAGLRPDQSCLGHVILASKGPEAGQHLTVIGIAAHWVSQDEADDFDLIGTDGTFSRHWSVTTYYRLATDEEAAPVIAAAAAAQAKRDEALRAKQALKQAGEDFNVRLAELTAGLIRTTTNYAVLADDAKPPYLLDWRDGDNYKSLKESSSKVTGAKAYIMPHGSYDDYRNDMFIDAETAVESFRLTRAEFTKYGEQTPATAAAWLEKYAGCVGQEYYQWLAKQEA